jgi:hypothetical protein
MDNFTQGQTDSKIVVWSGAARQAPLPTGECATITIMQFGSDITGWHTNGVIVFGDRISIRDRRRPVVDLHSSGTPDVPIWLGCGQIPHRLMARIGGG